MASTITNYSDNIDTDFPVPGVDNDTQGFRNNFSNIRDGLEAASTEIADIQLIQTGLITQINSITTPENIAASGIISTNITATNVTANGIVRAASFIGDGSQLTGISIGNALASLTISGGLAAGNTNISGKVTARSAEITGTVLASQFIGDGSRLTGIAATYTNLSSLATLALPTTDVSAKTVVASGEIRGQFFVGDGSQLTNVPYPSQELLSKLTVTGNSAFGGNLTISGTVISSSTITARSLALTETLSVTTASASYFVGDGSGLTNVGLANAYSATPISSIKAKNITLVDNANTVASSMYINNQQTLYVTDITKIVVVSTVTTSTVLASWSGSSGSFDINSLTFDSVPGTVNSGTNDFNVFKLWPADPEFHPVLSKVGTTITTTAFDISNALNTAGVTSGTSITFYKTNSPTLTTYATAVPLSTKGQVGDKKGMIIAEEGKGIYMCFRDYTDGIADIWLSISGASNTVPIP
jgi:hypothetical protein